MKINCALCGKEINKKPSDVAKSQNIFCSKKCHHEFMRKPNKYIAEGNTLKVFVNDIDFFLIDKDFEYLLNKRWRIYKGYVMQGKHTLLHRVILNCPSDYVVDHINHNPLDNRLSNLRICNRSQNSQNRKGATSVSKTKIRGVCFSNAHNKYFAYATINGIKHRKGFPNTEQGFNEAVLYAKNLRTKYLPYSQ